MAYKMYIASGEKIREVRMAGGLSEAGLAKKLGCTKEHIRLIESCTRKISPDMTERLCSYLGCRPESILCMEDGILTQAGAPVHAEKKKQDRVRRTPEKREGKKTCHIHVDAKRFMEIRKAARLAQKEFASILGLSPGTVSAIERGTADLPPDAMDKLCKYCSMPASYFQGEPNPIDISMHIHDSCLLQRLNAAAIECEGSPDSIDFAAKMLMRQNKKQVQEKL